MNIQIIDATIQHLKEMVSVMNAEDRAEAECLGDRVHRALWYGWKRSMIRKAVLVDGNLAAMFGVSGSLMGRVGRVWFVTGHKAREVSPHKFAAIYKQEVAKLLEIYPILGNYVDDRYVGAKKMLRIAGFKLEDPAPIGRFNNMFCRFYKEA